MVSVVFESTRAVKPAAEVRPAAVPAAAPAAAPSATRAPRDPIDWRAFLGRVLPPLAGMTLLVAIWGIATSKGGAFPTPAATFEAAVKRPARCRAGRRKGRASSGSPCRRR